MLRKILFCVVGSAVLFCVTARLYSQNTAASKDGFVIIAHRANMPGMPENTISAIRQCVAAGVDMIELDLRITGDGRLVILHDSTVQRTTDGTGSVRSLTLEQIRSLDAGSWCCPGHSNEKVPTLEEALAEISGSGVGLVLDVKDDRLIDPSMVLDLIRAYELSDRTVIGIRNGISVKSWRSSDPDIPILGFIPNQYQLEQFIGRGVGIIRLWPDWVDRDPLLIEKIHDRQCEVWVTAGDLPVASCVGYKERGIDGVLTDRSKELLNALAAAE